GSTLLVDEGWRLIIRSVRVEDTRAQYSCSVLDSLTGERRRSSPVNIDVAPMSVSSAPRGISHGQWEATVRRGGDVVLPCLVHANPPATITKQARVQANVGGTAPRGLVTTNYHRKTEKNNE
ncbi:hypothetical protein HW555_003428, partial [Spodoptera exigua]